MKPSPKQPATTRSSESATLKKRALAFLQSTPFMVLSTSDKDRNPHCATLLFTMDPDFTLYAVMHPGSLKSSQLLKNPKAAGLMWEVGNVYVQWHGTASIVSNQRQIDDVQGRLARKAADVEDFWPPIFHFPGEDYVVIAFKPTWMRAMDLTVGTIKSSKPATLDLI